MVLSAAAACKPKKKVIGRKTNGKIAVKSKFAKKHLKKSVSGSVGAKGSAKGRVKFKPVSGKAGR